MNGINFGMDGLSLDGTTWYNAKTGDSFKVRSNYFEDNNMKLQTTDGRVIDMRNMSDYVQWQGAGAPPRGPMEKPKPQKMEVPDEIKGMIADPDEEPGMLDDDLALIQGNCSVTVSQQPDFSTTTSLAVAEVAVKTEDQKMVERVLTKAPQPKVDYKVSWTKFPVRQMEMLVDFMGVSLDDICDYYINNISVDDIRTSIKQQLRTYIESHQTTDETPVTFPELKKPAPKKPAPKKK